jgi:hypothetical protein
MLVLVCRIEVVHIEIFLGVSADRVTILLLFFLLLIIPSIRYCVCIVGCVMGTLVSLMESSYHAT